MSTSSSSVSSTFSRASAHALSYYSASSTSSPFSDEYKVDRDGFLGSKHRAGGPYLCSFPVYSRAMSAEYEQRTGFHANVYHTVDTVETILAESSITWNQISLIGRQSKIDPEPHPIPTVLVITGPVPDQAPSAAKRYNDLLSHLSQDSVSRSSMKRKWTDIAAEILRQSDISEWTALECCRFGFGQSAAENPITVVVSVLRKSTSQWTTATRRIRGILSGFGEGEVHILFQKNEIQRFIQKPLSRDACTPSVKPGVSIGIHNSTAGSSTLGGLVQLQLNGREWQTFGLTCFHCVYAPDNHRAQLNGIQGAIEAFRRWRFQPVLPNDPEAKKILRVDHPSVSDLKEAVQDATSQARSLRNERFQKIEQLIREKAEGSHDAFIMPKDQKYYDVSLGRIESLLADRAFFQSFLDSRSYLLGSVFAGSGLYRTRHRNDGRAMTLDWALVEIPTHRLGPNEPFRYIVQEPQPFLFESAGAPKQGTNYHKVGRSTWHTESEHYGLESVHINRVLDPVTGAIVQSETWECAIYSKKKPFAEPGDCGSFVCDDRGTVVGLLHSGSDRGNNFYFTPILDIFQDIKLLTGAFDVQIAELY